MNNLSRYYPVLPLIMLLSIIFVISFSEYWIIAITQSPEVLKSYNFGSEAMVYYGGEKYRSAATYSEHNLTLALITLSCIAAIVGVMEKCNSRKVFKSYLLVTVVSAIWFFV